MRALLAILFTVYSFIATAEAQEYGLASVYSATFQGKRTASGEIFNHNDLIAAHQKYPFGSLVKITHMDNGKSVIVKIIDRGPFVSQRVADLSKAAAVRLGVSNEKEEIRVKLELIKSMETPQLKGNPNLNDDPVSASSSTKAENNTKNVEQQAVLKEYKHTGNKSSVVQKKSME